MKARRVVVDLQIWEWDAGVCERSFNLRVIGALIATSLRRIAIEYLPNRGDSTVVI